VFDDVVTRCGDDDAVGGQVGDHARSRGRMTTEAARRPLRVADGEGNDRDHIVALWRMRDEQLVDHGEPRGGRFHLEEVVLGEPHCEDPVGVIGPRFEQLVQDSHQLSRIDVRWLVGSTFRLTVGDHRSGIRR
jgi:hypothetical protein